MRKYIFAFVVTVLFFSTALTAQSLRDLGAPKIDEIPYPKFGIRLGLAPTAEISYQHPINQDNRLEFGFEYDGGIRETVKYRKSESLTANFIGMYQWIKRDYRMPVGMFYYYGTGAGLVYQENAIGAGALAQIGLEHNFEFPLQLSIDYRFGYYYNHPSMFIYSNTPPAFVYDNIRIGVRYCF